jgi:NAD(P)-dependent dehydrogenase (short-subunit alcohol dehydrogenase family)
MARIFITGSADGLGQLAAKSLVEQGHQVVLHARNEERAEEAMAKVPGAENALIADLGRLDEIISLAGQVNALGPFDAIIHNAGLYQARPKDLFTVNTLAPYLLTALVRPPQRLIYLSSGMHQGGLPKIECFQTGVDSITYSDTKLHVLLLCKAVARRWPAVYANAVNPGWVPTKMGGRGAPDSLQKGYETQVWLSVSNDEEARRSGRYFFHQREDPYQPLADDLLLQEAFLAACDAVTGVSFPQE